MSPRKKAVSLEDDQTRPARDQPGKVIALLLRVIAMPAASRFGICVLSSLILSSILYKLTASITVDDFAHVSKNVEEPREILGLIAWRTVEIGLVWIMMIDPHDIWTYFFVTHMPTYYILVLFYRVRLSSAALSFAILLCSISFPLIPTLCLPTIVKNRRGTLEPPSTVANRGILRDWLTHFYTTIAATSVFCVVHHLNSVTWMGPFMFAHFESLRTIGAAQPEHTGGSSDHLIFFLAMLPVGYSLCEFLFYKSIYSPADDFEKPANREGEYLIVSLRRKTWGKLPAKTRALVSRTLILTTGMLLNTIVQILGTFDRVDFAGSFAWGGVWAMGTLVVGAMFAWIGAVEGV
ncbi:hypothetical protein N7474_004094 [Penicillium riverlandense]|uniref:uncharacterized protein n=1 Tax=Penicillium riverlandense TaxID=1903569 RepID=UPI002548895B|nr:uncharacterized protein N7474_004094 [Penicillium riverlandense]KAJ5818503.1 hypothetical protein N7474_004094 [Penicillium riverlandense]